MSRFLIFLGLFSAIFGFCSAREITDKATGQSFPEEVSLEYEGKRISLQATGVATRKKFFFKIYSIASYLEDAKSFQGGNIFSNILNTNKAKQLTMKFVRNIPQSKVRDGYRESLAKVGLGQNPETNRFIGFFGSVSKGDTHILRSLPDGTVTVSINGQEKGSIKNPEFAKKLWGMWFGERSVVDRNKLVSALR